MTKAIGLLSGGLDSILAAHVIRDQGIDVQAITFETPFFSSRKAKVAAENSDIPLKVIDITKTHLEMLKKPPHGYGKNLNPCIDCHTLMIKIAGDLMKKLDAKFIFTGEVVGQRPMSQNRNAINLVGNRSGYNGYIVRPLSAKLLEPTKPELDGLLDREKLLDIQGRSRKIQFELAEKLNLTSYETPSGGCLLTCEGYCRKLKPLLDENIDFPIRYYHLLKVGRHFSLPSGEKLIVGKDEQDNLNLMGYLSPDDILLEPYDINGPTALIPDAKSTDNISLAAGILTRYSNKSKERISVKILCESKNIDEIITIDRFTAEKVNRYII